MKDMEIERSAFTRSVEITEKAIISRGKELKELVDKCTWSLLEDLTTIKYDGLKTMESENDEFGSHDNYLTDPKSTYPSDELHEGCVKIQQRPPKTPMQDGVISIRISFEISKWENFLDGNNIIGKIKREDTRVAVETVDAEVELHRDDKENNPAITDEKEVKEAFLNAEECEETAEDNELACGPMTIENEFSEQEAMSRKEETKTKVSKRKRPDRYKIDLQNIQRLPLLCATYTYSDQQGPASRVRKSHSISLIKTLNISRVWGVTKLDDSIYVLSWMPNSIRVFEDRNPFPLFDEIPIDKIQNPEDISANTKTKCLYVSDIHDKCIWEISPADHQVTKWLSNIDWPFTLSVSSDGHLLSLRDTPTQGRRELEIYGSEARLIRRFRLPSPIQMPLHAIQKPNGQFIIVHRLKDRENGDWVISHLTSDGQLIGHSIPTSKPLDWPFNMALDSEDDRLFVADYWNHRVIRFDSLSWSETILTETINRPLRLHFDAEKKQLIVANSRRLDIYSER